MKNLRIITLSAICMITSMNLLEAKASLSEKHSMKFTNNTANPLSIECKSQYRKVVNGIKRMRHDQETLTIPAGESKTWNYHTGKGHNGLPKYIKIKDTVNGKHLDLQLLKLKLKGVPKENENLINNKIRQLAWDEKSNNIINADYTITVINKNGATKAQTGLRLS